MALVLGMLGCESLESVGGPVAEGNAQIRLLELHGEFDVNANPINWILGLGHAQRGVACILTVLGETNAPLSAEFATERCKVWLNNQERCDDQSC